jgi:hypothetical protein
MGLIYQLSMGIALPNNELLAQNMKPIETTKLNKYRDSELQRLGRSS